MRPRALRTWYTLPMKMSFASLNKALVRARARWLGRMLVVGALILSLTGAGCTKLVDQETQSLAAPITLNMWGVIDDSDVYDAAIRAYQAQFRNVTINFRRLTLADYENELLNSMAEDRGPDIFLIHHDWTNKYLPKMSSMPPSVRVAERVEQGSIKKEVIWQAVTIPLMTNREFRDQFVDTVARDTIRQVDVSTDPQSIQVRERIVGVPTFIDTMGLYYNRSLLNLAGIALPPETWDEFQEDVRKLTKLDARDPTQILQSGAAIGLGASVERSPDLLAALMMQNGAVMANDVGSPTFHLMPEALSGASELPAAGALRFYTDFADPTKDVYTWNSDQGNSLEAFIHGKTAFFFGYAYQQELIKARAPQLNLGVTKLPQITGRPQQNVANYWFWTVSKRSKKQEHAWNFLNFMAQREQQQAISARTKRPSPRRDVLAEQLRDESIGVFASQVLTALTWYQGRDPKAMEQAFISLIDRVARKELNMEDAMRFAVDQVMQTY